MSKFNYENKQYLKKLNDLTLDYYLKYINHIRRNLKNKKSLFLDVGCGIGVVLKALKKEGFVNGYGVDISRLFIKQGKAKGLSNLFYYKGESLPFRNNFFDLVGSFNVLEHTDNPESFLKEQITKLKKGGIIIVASPNFLSVLFPSNHKRLKGINNKLRNLTLTLKKLLVRNNGFEKMKPLIRKNFEYDDDAIVVTNIIDVKRTLVINNCKITYESGFVNFDGLFARFINKLPLMKYLLPSCFLVAQKI
ncbi:MAG: hypothetical protein A2W22_03405 [Candidatus Levybacteria bacterium RBG_16_35_11]|nr:MAG: hypothetical protein A2W22_03405 [Candidatus Levybacteria bacterium RBG_16_35_11]